MINISEGGNSYDVDENFYLDQECSQFNLFSQSSDSNIGISNNHHLDVKEISIESAALKAKVSTATIRNWAKAGYFYLNQKSHIDRASFLHFLNSIEGQEKLTGRANKSQKDAHDHVELTSSLLQKIKDKNQKLNNFSDQYEASLSNSYKNKEGIYYTPEFITKNLLKHINRPLKNKTFFDPCCGSGNFILEAIEMGFSPENVYGYDTDPIAVEITKRRIFDRTGYITSNIKNKDFLDETLAKNTANFDVIYTNPPWGKKLSKKQKETYSKIYKAGRSIDTSSLFLFACLERLNTNGELAFLLPDSFFNIASFESARIKVLSLCLTNLIDYGKPFKGLMTKAFALILRKNKLDPYADRILCESNNKTHNRSLQSFLNNPKSIINFHSCTETAAVIKHIFAKPHTTLLRQAKWGLGIVTGNNKKFVQSNPEDGYIPIFKGSDIKKSGLKNPTCFIPNDLTLYQQVAPVELYEAKSKLIYKFISSNLCFYCDTNQRYVLNSANMLIPDHSFPITHLQLCNLLNSRLMNWLFGELFNTHKILKSDLETLPIHYEYFKIHPSFDERTYLEFLSIELMPSGGYRITK